ncbi:hypothetical protein [Methanotorris igneus]|uniref:Uncharacterized protein n=1 Tax=Methanotorris igneus (strain DSM 5666 / JCM 11834 / Kol 5) TaxID=880724 RepID=F6BEW8_METIK|nr:hypothetical protein [Methanotorris igneus]AEF95704.1 hypothetical protein Metig_0144 [Methanotorris igneus Kol 5]
MLKKIIFLVGTLLLFSVVYGEIWSDTKYPNDNYTENDINEIFNFPYDFEKIDKIEIKIIAFDVDASGKDYVYANNKKIGYLNYGDGITTFNINSSYIDSNGNIKMKVDKNDKMQINKSIMYVHYYNKTSDKNEIYSQIVKIEDKATKTDKSWTFNFPYYNDINIIINNIVIEIEAFGVNMGEDLVYADNEELGRLLDNNGFSTTTFTINYPKAEDILSDGSITIKVDKSKGDNITVNSITLTVYYTPKSSTSTAKAPIPLGVIALSLIGISFLLVRYYGK